MAVEVTADPQSEPLTFGQQALFAVFAGEPRDQVVYSFIAAAFAYVSALFSFGATAILVILFSITFTIGVIRLLFQWVSN